MAEKQFARSGSQGSDVFADDDPLAELARIVGFEPKPAAANSQRREPSFASIRPVEKPAEEAPVSRSPHPIFNLEDELLREFEMYDTPRNDNAAHGEPLAPVVAAPEPARENLPIDSAATPSVEIAEPILAETAAVDAAPAIEPPLPMESEPAFVPPFSIPAQPVQAKSGELTFDLADELEMALGHSAAPVLEAPAAPPVQPAPRFRSLATNFNMQKSVPRETATAIPDAGPSPAPVAALAIEPVARPSQAEPARREPAMEEPAIEWDRLADELSNVIVKPEAPQMPEGSFPPVQEAAADDLLDEVLKYPVPDSPLGVAPPQASLTPEVAAKPRPAASRFERAGTDTPRADIESEPAFDFNLDEIELELAEMSFDEPAPVLPPKPAKAAIPVELPVSKPPVAAAFVSPVAVAAPVVASMAMAKPAPVEPEPVSAAIFEETEAELPFDPTLIADAEEQPEVVPHLDVPPLPSVEPEETIAPEPEYDLDIDAEMANLFAPMSANDAEAFASPAMPNPLDAREPQRLDSGKAALDEFDEFERALEEDFRRAMGEPMAAGDHAQPMILGPGMSYAETEPRTRRLSRGLIMGVAAAIVGMAGLAGAYTYFTKSEAGSNGASTGPRVIAADTEPTKVVPENPGGKTVPNQDKAVYDRVAGNATEQPKQNSLLSSTEEPVDVVQRTLEPESIPMDNGEDAIANMSTPTGDTEDSRLLSDAQPAEKPATDGNGAAVSPRKVRTMIVKADGTLVARETEAPQPETAAPVKAPAKTDAKPALATPQTQQPPANTNANAEADAQTPEQVIANDAPLRTVKTTKVEAPSATPVPTSRPVDQPVNVVGTVTTQGQVRKPAAQAQEKPQEVAAATSTATAAPGGYVIQVASLPSEAEAKKSYSSLSSKFGSVIGGRGYEIKKAEISGKGTFYRVRIPVGSKDAAAALCVKYRAAGGTCLVSK